MSSLVGAAAIGANSILVRRGKKLQQSKTVEAQNVFDIPALKFMDYIQSLKQSDDDLLSPDFLIGARANILNPEPDWAPTTLYRKCDAGANLMTTGRLASIPAAIEASGLRRT